MRKRWAAGALCAAMLLFGMAAPAQAFEFPLRLEQAQEQQKKPIPRGTALCDTALLSLPEDGAPAAGSVGIGEELDIYAVNINGGWDAVMTADGTLAYIRSTQVSLTAPTYAKDGRGEDLVTDGGENGYPGELYNDGTYLALMTEAKKYIGYPYVFGGSTPQTSFDCSGYVCWVFTHAGVYDLGRTDAQGIYDLSQPIAREEARPGDLVFFQGTYDTPNTVTHVAIYVGNSYMLHCGNPIGYSPVDTPYWTDHFFSFGRLKG